MGPVTPPPRRRLAPLVAALALAGLAACGGGDSSADVTDGATRPPASTTTEAPSTSEGVAGEDPATTTTGAPTTGTAPADRRVPISDELVERLPPIDGYTRDISDDDSFSEQQCDGSVVGAVPAAQAEANYVGGPDGLVMGAVQFTTEEAAGAYLAGFVASLVACDVGGDQGTAVDGVGNLGQEAAAIDVRTGDQAGTVLVARQRATVWYFLQEVEGGIEALEAPVVGAFQQAVG